MRTEQYFISARLYLPSSNDCVSSLPCAASTEFHPLLVLLFHALLYFFSVQMSSGPKGMAGVALSGTLQS